MKPTKIVINTKEKFTYLTITQKVSKKEIEWAAQSILLKKGKITKKAVKQELITQFAIYGANFLYKKLGTTFKVEAKEKTKNLFADFY
jgi:hypothetical protein